MPSLKRLSDSTSSRSRPVTPASLKVAMTDTGSVAEMSSPSRDRRLPRPTGSGNTAPPLVTTLATSTPPVAKQEHHRSVVAQLAPVHVEGRLEDEWRQETP